VVLLIPRAEIEQDGVEAIRARAEQVSGVPVRIEVNDLLESNMSVVGGDRVEGGAGGGRHRCTTGFVVTNGEQNAIVTAAHCPDQLTYDDNDGTTVQLPMIGSWGAAYRDVQINGSAASPEPLFYANRGAGSLRRLQSWR